MRTLRMHVLARTILSVCLVLVPVAAHLFRTVEIVEKSMLYARTEIVQQECCNQFYAKGMNNTRRFLKYMIIWGENYQLVDVAPLTCNTMLSQMNNDPCYWQIEQKRLATPETSTDYKSRNYFLLKSSDFICKCITAKQDAWIMHTQKAAARAKDIQLHQRQVATIRTKGETLFTNRINTPDRALIMRCHRIAVYAQRRLPHVLLQ
jgi:hypothetical protein